MSRAFFCIMWLVAGAVFGQDSRPAIEWKTDLAAARAAAREAHRPLCVVFRCER